MYFQRLTFDLDEGRVRDARIADPDIFSDAHVNWAKLSRPDRPWIASRLHAIVTAWTGLEAPTGAWTLAGTPRGDDPATYALTPEVSDEPAASWEGLTDEARGRVELAIQEIFECVHGLIEIY